MTITPAIKNMLRELLTDPGLRMSERPPAMPPPIVATVREIDFSINNNIMEAFYSAANYEVDIQNFGTINEVLRRLANNLLPLNDDPTPKPPFISKLSLMNKRYCYVVFKLTGKNWQFSHDKDPFSIGLDSIDPEAYFEPRKVDDQGNILSRGTTRDNCRIAYFIADGATAYDDSNNYIDPFNFHLDLIVTDSDGQPAQVPIVIDPDVRYPGGSGEP